MISQANLSLIFASKKWTSIAARTPKSSNLINMVFLPQTFWPSYHMKPANGNIWVLLMLSGLFASSVPLPFKLFPAQCTVKSLTPKHHSQWWSAVSFLPTVVRRFRSLRNEFLGPRGPHGVEADEGAIFVENDQWCFLLALLVSCAAESLICAWDVVAWWFGAVGHPLIACPSCKRKSRMCCKLVWPYEAASMREPGYTISLLLHAQFVP